MGIVTAIQRGGQAVAVTIRGTRQPGSWAGLYKLNFDRYYSLQVAPVTEERVGHYGEFL